MIKDILEMIEKVDPADSAGLDEKWVLMKGFEASHAISNYGRVISLPRKITDSKGRKYTTKAKILARNITKLGYNLVHLSVDNKNDAFSVHRLVARHFIGESDLCVNHKDRNKLNNHVSNLEYVTYRGNTNHWREGGKELPIGVSKHNKRYRARICCNGKERHIGTYDTPEEAKEAYDAEVILSAIKHERGLK